MNEDEKIIALFQMIQTKQLLKTLKKTKAQLRLLRKAMELESSGHKTA